MLNGTDLYSPVGGGLQGQLLVGGQGGNGVLGHEGVLFRFSEGWGGELPW